MHLVDCNLILQKFYTEDIVKTKIFRNVAEGERVEREISQICLMSRNGKSGAIFQGQGDNHEKLKHANENADKMRRRLRSLRYHRR